MRTELGLIVVAAFVSFGSVAMAEERNGDQCLSGICLGESVSALPEIEWLPITGSVSHSLKPPEDFPRYERIVDPGSAAIARSIQDALVSARLNSPFPSASSWVDPVEILLSNVHGLSEANRAAFRKEARSVGSAIALSPEGIAGLGRLSGVTFCPDVEFVGHFRSKSGHPTTVGFAPVTNSDGTDTFIVDAIVRRIPTDVRAMDKLFEELQKDHPSVVHDRDLTTSCGTTGFRLCEEPRPGLAKHPDDWTAAQKARLQLKDFFVRFEPRFDEVLISLRLFSANSEPLTRSLQFYGLSSNPIPSRIERNRPAVCEQPPAEVPSIE